MVEAIGATGRIGATGGPKGVQSPPGSSDEFAAILGDFMKAARETPAEKARRTVLERHKLSESDYQRLPAKARQAIDREIQDAVARAIKAKIAAHGNVPLENLNPAFDQRGLG